MANILICDDEEDIVRALRIYLESSEHTVYEAFNGQEAVEILGRETVHLIMLDIMMPVLDGMEALARIRQVSNVPVIMLTAKSEDADKVLGLNLGADDYITKPFSPLEVMARVNSQLRRYMKLGGNPESEDTYVIGGIELDDLSKEVRLDGQLINLTPKEYDILKLLMQNPGKVFSPKEIYRTVWNEIPFGTDNTVAVHIRHLREKLEINPAQPRYIKVIFGQGYKMEKLVR